MRNIFWKSILAWLLAAFFFVGGIGNILASDAIQADYARWGYPFWFHYLTGTLELIAGALLISLRTRKLGSGLAAVVMCGAAATVLAHGEFTHAIAPLVVLSLSVFVWFTVE
ncbi:DoxX family protein [Ketogulonicigenium vulgare]|uniref:DoxX family protein n=2 Tax=Ketogulonicigenium vulgare TaxID=92945 RepID=F9Y4M8_KETVW|nr:DoxX family protein [Ketogulonicigenium vulgare]AEM40585.1 DoxX family protein [Ketogulonicigenium vulgare WSH-001]ALJ82288.1 DoxX family protein [Ketogulonicigenium vulgare]ANW34977.1 DoxX family protein [Ketogulonicigenium vulgare]